MDLSEILNRLRLAGGSPDRELDAAIFEAIIAVPNTGQKVGAEGRRWDPEYTPLLVHSERYGFLPAVPGDAEGYTSSVDAAMTLIPKGCYLDLHDWTWAEGSCWCAALITATGERLHAHAKAPTPSLAICIVALEIEQYKRVQK